MSASLAEKESMTPSVPLLAEGRHSTPTLPRLCPPYLAPAPEGHTLESECILNIQCNKSHASPFVPHGATFVQQASALAVMIAQIQEVLNHKIVKNLLNLSFS